MSDTFLADCRRLFNTQNVYEVLGLDKDKKYDDAQVKRAYYKVSLVYHPDRADTDNQEHKEHTGKFQVISKAFELLKSKKLRNQYNKTGELNIDGFDFDEDTDWYSVWRGMFRPITEEDIEKFRAEYQGSEGEREDVQEQYIKHEGNMDYIMESVMCASADDEHRYVHMIQPLIANGVLPEYKAWTRTTSNKAALARKRKAQKEAKEADQMRKQMAERQGAEEDDLGSLRDAILGKSKARHNNMIDSLEAKYGGGAAKAKKK